MRLGVVLTGIGACAAASAGALTWLLDAGVAPYAVCGMQAAAWPAALYLVGYDADRLRGAAVQAARAGRRLLTADASARDVLGMKKSAICRGRRLEKLLAAQTGERALGLCERQGVFLCRAARSRPRRCLLHAERDAGWGDCDAASFDGFCRARGAFASSVRLNDGMDGFAAAPDG